MSERSDSIVREIVDKVSDYEARMGNWLTEYNEWSDIYTVKKPARKRNLSQFSNPRSTEMFRAVNALSTLEYRMLTASDPYFDILPMDLSADNVALSNIQSTLETQLEVTQYKRNLLRAITSKILCGTVIVEEPFEKIGLNPFGQYMYATSFRPRSMLQVAFDRNCYDIDEADWLSTCDMTTKSKLMGLLGDSHTKDAWVRDGMEAAIADDSAGSSSPLENVFVAQRLAGAGYSMKDERSPAREMLRYHGKLECLNDGIEYIVVLINRKHLVRFQANRFQHGRRAFRVGRWIEHEVEPLGYGVGKLLGNLHRSIDSNRMKVTDSITFDTYSMWLKDRMAGINDQDFKVIPFNVVETDNVNGLRRLESNVAGATLGLKLEDMLKDEFRNASGATSTMQAIVTEATASEVSLAQNEAMRAVSVRAELAAESLVRQHLEIMHSNNVQLLDEAMNVNVGGKVRRIYPSDLWYNVNFRVRCTTDKDFKPQRLKSMVEILQILTSIRNEHPEKFEISVIPIVQEIARSLGINAESLIRPAAPPPGLPAATTGGPALPPEMVAALSQQAAAAGPSPVAQTPVGDVLVSPR